PERDLAWSEAGIEGAWRFVPRVWRLADGAKNASSGGEDVALRRALHKTIAGVTADIDALHFNKAVARLYELSTAIEKAAPSGDRQAAVVALVKLVAPMVPHLAEEAWAHLGQDGLVATADWPKADPALLVEDSVTVAIQINGKLRD